VTAAAIAATGVDERSASGPLSGEHLRILAAARARGKKVRRAAKVAAFSGGTMMLFAAATLIGGLFGDWTSLVLGIILAAIAYIELRGGAMLGRFEPGAARLLGYNQMLLAVVIIAYAAWSLLMALRSPMLAQLRGATGDPQMEEMVGQIATWTTYGLYGCIAFAGLIGPPMTALYYFSRARLVRAMLAETPPWAIETLRVAG